MRGSAVEVSHGSDFSDAVGIHGKRRHWPDVVYRRDHWVRNHVMIEVITDLDDLVNDRR
jgi:hypothetical protein